MENYRKILEKAVGKYKKITNKNFLPAKKIDSKKLSNAAKNSGRRITGKDIVAFLDTTLFGSGKNGIILTEESLIFTEHKNDGIDVRLVTKAEVSGSELKAYYPSGGFKRIKVSIYAEETASLLNAIAKERLLSEKAELEKAEKEIPAPAPEKKEPAPAKKPRHDADYYLKLADECYNDKDYRYALEYYEKAAEKGNPVAQNNCGMMYFLGQGTEKNIDAAAFWFERAAEGGNVYSEYNLGVFYSKGIYFDTDKKEAFRWFRKAAESGYAAAMFACGEARFNGEGIARDYDEALNWYKKAAAAGHEKAKEALENFKAKAAAAEAKRNAPPEEGSYKYCFSKALSGDVQSMLKIAALCEKEGKAGEEPKLHEALFWNLFAADEGSPEGAGNVGRFLENGIGIPVNNEEAVKWYKKSPLHTTNYKILEGEIKCDEVEAVPDPDEYENFVLWAEEYGKFLREEGIGFEERFYGFALIYIAASFDDADAQYALGIIYSQDSDIGKRDLKKEKRWMLKAYKNDSEDAINYVFKSSYSYFD